MIDMKDGFDFEGANLEVSAGSFGRRVSNIEFGGNDGKLAYYLNIEHFNEAGAIIPSQTLLIFTLVLAGAPMTRRSI